ARHFEFLLLDVFPHVHLGPIRERKDAHVFTRIETRIVKVPDFGALVLGVPLPKDVAEAEEALLGARLFLITPRAADAAIKSKFFNGAEQRRDLETVAADLALGQHGRAAGDGVVHGADDELGAELFRTAVAKFQQPRKFVPRFSLEEGHWNGRGTKGFFAE